MNIFTISFSSQYSVNSLKHQSNEHVWLGNMNRKSRMRTSLALLSPKIPVAYIPYHVQIACQLWPLIVMICQLPQIMLLRKWHEATLREGSRETTPNSDFFNLHTFHLPENVQNTHTANYVSVREKVEGGSWVPNMLHEPRKLQQEKVHVVRTVSCSRKLRSFYHDSQSDRECKVGLTFSSFPISTELKRKAVPNFPKLQDAPADMLYKIIRCIAFTLSLFWNW